MNEDNFKLLFLELQRSALIDTQTIFQLLIEKEICTVDEITQMRQTVECNNADVARIDQEIAAAKGEKYIPKSLPRDTKKALMEQLQKLLQEGLSSSNK